MHQKVGALGDALPPDYHWKLVATSRCQRSQSMRDFWFSGKLRISWSQMLHCNYKAIHWWTQISLIMQGKILSQHANQRLLIRKEISHMLDEMSGNHTSSMKDTAAFAMIMMASVTRQLWGTHTIWVEAEPQEWIQHQTHTCAQTVSVSKITSRKLSMAGIGCSMMTKRKIYRPMQDSKNGPSEKHFRQTRYGRRWGEKQSIND